MDKEKIRRELEAGRAELRVKITQFQALQQQPPSPEKNQRLLKLAQSLENINHDFTAETEFYFLILSEIVCQKLNIGRIERRAQDVRLEEYLALLQAHGERLSKTFQDTETKAIYFLLSGMYAYKIKDHARALEELNNYTALHASFSDWHGNENIDRLKDNMINGEVEPVREVFTACMDQHRKSQLDFILRIWKRGKDLSFKILDKMHGEANIEQAGVANETEESERFSDLSDAGFFVVRGARLHDQGKFQQALENYNRTIRLQPGLALGYFERAKTYAVLGQDAEALADFDKAIMLDPDNSRAYTNRGIYYQERKQVIRATRDFKRALELDPANAPARLNHGILRSEAKDYSGALEEFEQVIRSQPENAEAYFNRAITWSNLEDNQKALEDLDRAIQHDPRYVCAYLLRAGIRLEKKQREKSLADFQAFFKLDSEQHLTKKFLELLPLQSPAAEHTGFRGIRWKYVFLLLLLAALFILGAYLMHILGAYLMHIWGAYLMHIGGDYLKQILYMPRDFPL